MAPDAAAQVEFLADRRCCVCREAGHQIHHINGDHSDNELDNLVLLCFLHHDEASRIGGLSRKLNAQVIKRYRSAWFAVVERRRAVDQLHPVEAKSAEPTDERMLAILARHDVKKLGFKVEALTNAGWSVALDQALLELFPYVETRSVALAQDILEVLSGVTSHTRNGMPPKIAHTISTIASCAMPTRSLQAPSRRPITAEELNALKVASYVGANIAYDAAMYLRNLSVFDAGISILWGLSRYAHLNKHAGLREAVEEAFESAADGARRSQAGPFGDALRWLEFKRADALALETPPAMPSDLWDQIFASLQADDPA